MSDEDGFLHAIKANPHDQTARLVYADWLEERDDPRGDFVRLHLALRAAGPDHVDRVAGEHELSELRKGCGEGWLAVVEPEGVQPRGPSERRACGCFEHRVRLWFPPVLHAEAQDTECSAWKRLLDLVEEAAADGREEFAPLDDLPEADRARIATLPATVAKLNAVKVLNLSGSCLVRIPPEVGEMAALERFVPYTSYRLHWFPYELTRCKNLQDSTVSTQALYGNYKDRPMFPTLGKTEPVRLPLKRRKATTTRPCSVCGRPFEDRRLYRVWVSLTVATDVLPLLVNACSEECVWLLPAPPEGYVPIPHRGGLGVQQPPPR
jgi:uncharacterized protein (TIGR02996 family)